MKTKIDFITGNTRKSLFAMTIPLLFSMVLMMAYNIVDSVWVGNMLGEEGYAALTNSSTIVMILSSITMGAGNGVSILVSQAIGAKNKKKAESVIATSLTLSALFSIVVIVLVECFLPQILHLLNTPAETMDSARQYLFIYILGFFAILLYMQFTAIFRSFGDPVFQVKGMLISTLLNAAIDPLFIHFWGLAGAAAASLISQILCLIFAIIYLKKKKYFKLHWNQFDAKQIVPIFANTIPSAIQQAMPAISATFITALVSSFGVTTIAGYGVSGRLEIILFYPAMALNMALTTIVGQCTGAKRDDRGRDYTKTALLYGTGLMIVLSLLVIGFAGGLSHMFVPSANVAAIVAHYLHVVSIGYVCYLITSCFLGTLSGLGQPGKSMLLMALYYIIIRIPLAWLLVHTTLALDGIWIAILISHIVAVLAAFFCYRISMSKHDNIEAAVSQSYS